jgi:hypothetical protein
MFKIIKDYKIPYINRMIPEGTGVKVIGSFTQPEDDDKIKVRIIQVPHIKNPTIPSVEFDTVYGIKESLLTK